MDGAAQIVTPAFVSLLCICIVFVPMFFLHGRRALPVRADGRSGDVGDGRARSSCRARWCRRWRTICCASTRRTPTCTASTGRCRRSRNPLVRFQRGFERRFERFRARLSRAADAGAAPPRRLRRSASSSFVFASFALAPFLGRDFFPSVDAGQILMHVRTRVGTRVEESANQFADIQKAIRQIIPPDELGDAGRQHRHAGQRHQHDLQQHRHDRHAGRRHPDQAQRRTTGRPPNTSASLREELPARFPGVTFSFLPADIISQILNFGAPAPIDLQIRGPNLDANFAYAQKLLRRLRHVPGPGRRAHPAVARQPGLQRRRRPHARAICRRDRARRDQQHGGQPRRQQPGRADLLAQSRQRRVLSDRDADAAIPDRLARTRCRTCRSRRPARRRRRSARIADINRATPQRGRLAIQHPADGPDLRHHAGPRSRRGRGRRAEGRRRDGERACRRARRSSCSARCGP